MSQDEKLITTEIWYCEPLGPVKHVNCFPRWTKMFGQDVCVYVYICIFLSVYLELNEKW